MDQSSLAQFYTPEELEAAVTFGNVRAFYDPDYMTTAERAKALAYDPEFPKKCKSFRSLSKEHSRLFFSWTDGKSSTPQTCEAIIGEVPKGHFNSTPTFGFYKRSSPSGVREQQEMQQEQAERSPKVSTPQQGEFPRSRRRLDYQYDEPSRATSNARNSPPIYHSPSELVDNPPTPEMKKLEKIVEALTPRKIPSQRKQLLVRSLLDFGVETLDDLEGFTYEQLRSDLCLHAFTGVQLKRLLVQAKASKNRTRSFDQDAKDDESSEELSSGDVYTAEYSDLGYEGSDLGVHRSRKQRKGNRREREAKGDSRRSAPRRGGKNVTYDASAEELGSSGRSSMMDSSELPSGGGRRSFLWTATGAILFGAAMAGVIHYGLNHHLQSFGRASIGDAAKAKESRPQKNDDAESH